MRKIYYYIIIFLAIALALSVLAGFRLQDADAEIVFLDVGQGDAILIQQGTEQILIDGGSGSSVVEKLGNYMPFWDRKIETVMLSHPHADHYAGLIDVFERFEVEKFIWTGALEEAKDFEVFLEKVAAENCEEEIAHANRDYKFGEEIDIDILYPFSPHQFTDQEVKNMNNTSFVAKVVSPNKAILLTGDAEKEVEEELLNHNIYLQADILKAGHHGSKTSSSENFVKAVDPEKAIFCAGENNKFNHPAELIVERYESLGIEPLTLWETGDIKVEL